MLAQEEELGELLKELSGHERSSSFEVAIYQSIRQRGPGVRLDDEREADPEADQPCEHRDPHDRPPVERPVNHRLSAGRERP